jgi:membrane protease YdiL (CAAX protease family)
LVLVLSVGVALLLHSKDLDNALSAGDRRGVMTHLVPAAFFAALIPLDWILPRLTRLRRRLRIRSAQHVRAIWASSALFAAVHANVWPSPVPLVVLAVGLGYLYVRTRTLVGPVVVHGLFNAVSAVYLLLGGPA